MAEQNLQLEVLKIARDMLMDEYVERVNQLEQRWSAESALYWRAYQRIIPYPTMPAPPTVEDILEKAQMLLEFFNGTYEPWYESTATGNVWSTPGNVTPMPANVVVDTSNVTPMPANVVVDTGNVTPAPGDVVEIQAQ